MAAKNVIMLDVGNARVHDEENRLAIRNSLTDLGAGRSIVVDKENVIIAGNGVFEQAQELGLPVKVIETDGTELVVIKRTDLATDDDKRKALALADNKTSDLSFFDDNALAEIIGSIDDEALLAATGFSDDELAKLVAIEASKEMAALYDGPGELFRCDAVDFEYRDYDLAVVFLLFMFIAPGRRDGLLRKLVDRIKPGGALIVVDKVQVDDGYISTVMHRLTMFGKTLNGVSADEIVSKEMSLAGAQRPICPEVFFSGCRYHEFFRFGEFAGWMLSK